VREYAWLHTELIPYIYTHVVACHLGGEPLMRPLEAKYHYLFGEDFLVAPIYEDSFERTVSLPEGHWRYLFADNEIIEGPKTITRDFPLDEFPVYVRDGAVVPLNVSREYTGYGDRMSEGFLTWLIYPRDRSEFEVVHPDGSGRSAIAVDNTGDALDVRVGGEEKAHILRIKMDAKPESITIDGVGLIEGTHWNYDADATMLVIRTRSYVDGHYVIERGG
jgi:alpha-glucosidase (family GH31 glycosyl hydrolase)